MRLDQTTLSGGRYECGAAIPAAQTSAHDSSESQGARSAQGRSAGVNEQDVERALQLAREHCAFIDELLTAHGCADHLRNVVRFHYSSAFVHGYKHAIDDLTGGDV